MGNCLPSKSRLACDVMSRNVCWPIDRIITLEDVLVDTDRTSGRRDKGNHQGAGVRCRIGPSPGSRSAIDLQSGRNGSTPDLRSASRPTDPYTRSGGPSASARTSRAGKAARGSPGTVERRSDAGAHRAVSPARRGPKPQIPGRPSLSDFGSRRPAAHRRVGPSIRVSEGNGGSEDRSTGARHLSMARSGARAEPPARRPAPAPISPRAMNRCQVRTYLTPDWPIQRDPRRSPSTGTIVDNVRRTGGPKPGSSPFGAARSSSRLGVGEGAIRGLVYDLSDSASPGSATPGLDRGSPASRHCPSTAKR